jgi:hypothetical protein
MGEPLTKAELDRTTAAWREHCAASGYPVDTLAPAAKSFSAAEVKIHSAALIKAIMVGIAPVIHELEKQVGKLQSRIEELERSQKTYLGVWKAGREYSPQSEVTHDGARWYCCKSTSNKPGASADWTLMEKSEPTAHPRSDTSVTSAERVNGPHPNPRFR